MSLWRRLGLGGGGDIRGGSGGGLRSRGGGGRDGRLVRRGGCGIRGGRRRDIRTLATGTGTADTFGRRGLIAGLDVGGPLLQLGGTGAEARGALGGGQLGRGLTIHCGTGPSTPVAGFGVVTRRQRSGHARPIGTICRHGAAVAHGAGSGHARPIGAIGGTDHRIGGLWRGRLRLLGEDRRAGEQEGRKEEGCSHGGIPFCKIKITHRHFKNKVVRERRTENRKQNAGRALPMG